MNCCLEPSRRHPEKQFLLAGPLYPWNWEWPENVRRMEHVAPADHSRFYSSSRITLNITRGEMAANGWCPSGRFFEAAACGTPLLTDAWEGLDTFFDLRNELRVVARAEDVQDALSMARTMSCNHGRPRPAANARMSIPAWSAPGSSCTT